MLIKVKSKRENFKYDIHIGKDNIFSIGALLKKYYKDIDNKKFLIITDKNIPNKYINIIKKDLKNVYCKKLQSGENTKSYKGYKHVLDILIKKAFCKNDVIIALGGGVIGDLSSFIAGTYMRGIDFINIPTSLLAQVDASIGGKSAINFSYIKNIIGVFNNPKFVLIDINLLKTLPIRHISNGLAESLKMAIILDKNLFLKLKRIDLKKYLNDKNAEKFILDYNDLIFDIIYTSVMLKKKIVEQDFYDNSIRKILNFGHTIGHIIELSNNDLLHGECVAYGMYRCISKNMKKEVLEVFIKLNLPYNIKFSKEEVIKKLYYDKKINENKIVMVFSDKIGEFKFENKTIDEIKKLI